MLVELLCSCHMEPAGMQGCTCCLCTARAPPWVTAVLNPAPPGARGCLPCSPTAPPPWLTAVLSPAPPGARGCLPCSPTAPPPWLTAVLSPAPPGARGCLPCSPTAPPAWLTAVLSPAPPGARGCLPCSPTALHIPAPTSSFPRMRNCLLSSSTAQTGAAYLVRPTLWNIQLWFSKCTEDSHLVKKYKFSSSKINRRWK